MSPRINVCPVRVPVATAGSGACGPSLWLYALRIESTRHLHHVHVDQFGYPIASSTEDPDNSECDCRVVKGLLSLSTGETSVAHESPAFDTLHLGQSPWPPCSHSKLSGKLGNHVAGTCGSYGLVFSEYSRCKRMCWPPEVSRSDFSRRSTVSMLRIPVSPPMRAPDRG